MSEITIEKVTKRFENAFALNQVSFSIPKGQIFGLLGPNGAGKTTLMRILVGLLGPDEGRIDFHETSARNQRERLGYLPEERGLYPKMKVADILRFCAAIKSVPKQELQARIQHGLERVGLDGQEKKKAQELSKGNQQRVQLLTTLLHQPDLMILDEPFSGLDPIGADQMKQILREETRRGATVILSTHRMEDAEELCSHIALINRGKVVLNGPLGQIRSEQGKDELVVEYEGDYQQAVGISGTEIEPEGDNHLRIRLLNGSTVPSVVRELSARINVLRVERTRMRLHDIFVRLVGESVEAQS